MASSAAAPGTAATAAGPGLESDLAAAFQRHNHDLAQKYSFGLLEHSLGPQPAAVGTNDSRGPAEHLSQNPVHPEPDEDRELHHGGPASQLDDAQSRAVAAALTTSGRW